MVADEFQELLDVGRAVLVELSVVDVNHDLFKVVLLLLPVQIIRRLGPIVLAEVLVEYAHCQVFEVVLLKSGIDYTFEVKRNKSNLKFALTSNGLSCSSGK